MNNFRRGKICLQGLTLSAIALMVESTFEAVESTICFVLSTTVETAESVLAAASLPPPPHDVKAAAITITVRNFFIQVVFCLRKTRRFLSKKQDMV